MKTCSKCGISQEESEFYKRGAATRSDCKSCGRLRSYKYRRTEGGMRTKEAYVSSAKGKYATYKGNVKKFYNITPEEVQYMMDNQRGCCPICHKSLDWSNSGRSYDIDHDHDSGQVRGLLCRTCNTGLGQFQEDVDTLLGAITYLKDNRIV